MTEGHSEPTFTHHVDWIVFTRDWGTWSEPCESLDEARDLSRRTGGGVLLQTRVFDENGGSGTSVALHTNK